MGLHGPLISADSPGGRGGYRQFYHYFFIKNYGKSIYRDLGTICIFLIRKNHEISTSQRVCRWSVALFSSIFVFFMGGGTPHISSPIYLCIYFGKATSQALCMPSYMPLPNLLPSFAKLCQMKFMGGTPPSTGDVIFTGGRCWPP